MSLPVRERGLKHAGENTTHNFNLSLPVRERGLKHLLPVSLCLRAYVAPRAGAWIETTIRFTSTSASDASLPVRERPSVYTLSVAIANVSIHAPARGATSI